MCGRIRIGKHFLTVRPGLTLCLKDSPAYVRLNTFGYDDYFYGSVDGDRVLEVRLDPFAKPRNHSLPIRNPSFPPSNNSHLNFPPVSVDNLPLPFISQTHAFLTATRQPDKVAAV